MKLKELHSYLQDVEPFARPKPALEQYPTGADIASRMLFTIDSAYGDIEGRVVVDLGTGTGMLAIGAALLGAAAVVGVDVDGDALDVARRNVAEFDGGLPIDFVRADVSQMQRGLQEHHHQQQEQQQEQQQHGGAQPPSSPPPPPLLRTLQADTVIMNPPFGTKAGRKGADVAFLRAAAALRPRAVYSLHKSSTRRHIEKVALRELGCVSAEVVAELRYELPATMRFHKRDSVDIEVDVWRLQLVVPDDGGGGAAGAGAGRGRGGSSGGGGGGSSSSSSEGEGEGDEDDD